MEYQNSSDQVNINFRKYVHRKHAGGSTTLRTQRPEASKSFCLNDLIILIITKGEKV